MNDYTTDLFKGGQNLVASTLASTRPASVYSQLSDLKDTIDLSDVSDLGSDFSDLTDANDFSETTDFEKTFSNTLERAKIKLKSKIVIKSNNEQF